MNLSISTDELYSLIKKAVREVIHEKEVQIILNSIPEVSDEEMQEITDKYGVPGNHRDVAFSEKLDI